MVKIKLLVNRFIDDKYVPDFDEHDGEIYKGFGIIGGMGYKGQYFSVIHLPSGRIIPVPGLQTDISSSKKSIDELNINSSMDYEEMMNILHIQTNKLVAPIKKN